MAKLPRVLFLLTAIALSCHSLTAVAADLLKTDQNGLSINDSQAFVGYALVAPMNSTTTYLIDNDARIVNQWKSDYTPALSAYLLPNGHLLRPGAERGGMGGGPGGGGPGAGGRIQEFDWDGKLVWDFSISSLKGKYSKLRPHHDICPLPNGNVLVVCTDPKTKDECVKAGRLPTIAPDELQTDCIIEIQPQGKKGGKVVWEWHSWDHLIQDAHEKKDNYGDVSEHPELIDVNFVNGMMDRMMQDPEQLAKLRSLGYVGGGGGGSAPANNDRQSGDNRDDRGSRQTRDDRRGRGGFGGGPGGGGPGGGMGSDWMHVNAVAYNPQLDQVMISVHEFSEVWIVDHSTSTEEAASHAGGKSGKGGDLLYRWGNPRSYRSGTNIDQRLFAQHCAHWIAEGLPGEGNMLVFNNGMNRPDGNYSSSDEIQLPVNSDGSYNKEEYVAYEPFEYKWRYGSPENTGFSSMLISGCQRLSNGNTFICSGNQGILFEVTPEGEIVWQFKMAGGEGGPGGGGPGGPGGFGGPGGPGGFGANPGEEGLIPTMLAQMLQLSDEQLAKIEELEKDIDGKLAKILSPEQLAKLKSPPAPQGQRGFTPPKPGQVVPEELIAELNLNGQQGPQLQQLQGEVTKSLNRILNRQQLSRIREMEQMFAQAGPQGFGGPGGQGGFGSPDGNQQAGPQGQQGGPQGQQSGPQGFAQQGGPQGFGGPGGFGFPGGFGGPGGGGPGGFGGPGGGGPGGGGPGGGGGVFRAYKYAVDYPGLADKELTPGEKLEEVSAQAPEQEGRGGRSRRDRSSFGRPQ